MIQLSVALVVAGSVFAPFAGSDATSRPEESRASIESLLSSPAVVPREFKFQVESPAEEIDPVAAVEHAEKLRYEADRLDLRDHLPNPLPATFLALNGSGVPGSAEDLIYYLPPEPPNLWADISMPVEPRADFLGVSLLGFGVWAIYRAWGGKAAES